MVAWSGEIAEEIMRNDQIFDVKVRLAGMCEKKENQSIETDPEMTKVIESKDSY